MSPPGEVFRERPVRCAPVFREVIRGASGKVRSYSVLLPRQLVPTAMQMRIVPAPTVPVNGSTQCDQELLMGRHRVLLWLHFQGSAVLSGRTVTSHRWLLSEANLNETSVPQTHWPHFTCSERLYWTRQTQNFSTVAESPSGQP